MALLQPPDLWLPPKPAIIRPAKLQDATAFAFGGSGGTLKTPSCGFTGSGLFGPSNPPWSATVTMGTVNDGNDFCIVFIGGASSLSANIAGRGMTALAISSTVTAFILSPANTSGLGAGGQTLSVSGTGASSGGGWALCRVYNANATATGAAGGTTSVGLTSLPPKCVIIGYADATSNGVTTPASAVGGAVAQVFSAGNVAKLFAHSGGNGFQTGAGTATVTASGTLTCNAVAVAFKGHT